MLQWVPRLVLRLVPSLVPDLPRALPPPPRAQRRPVTTTLHGHTRVDPYRWLREASLPEVQAHLKTENAYCEAWFEPWTALREELYNEMLARIQEDDDSVPWREHGWWTTQRTVQGQAYPTYWRWQDGSDPQSRCCR